MSITLAGKHTRFWRPWSDTPGPDTVTVSGTGLDPTRDTIEARMAKIMMPSVGMRSWRRQNPQGSLHTHVDAENMLITAESVHTIP